MLKHFLVVIVIAGFVCCLFGVWHIFLEVEDNACRMTYMFGQPQFSRVKLDRVAEAKRFPNYGLYYYYEGAALRDVNRMSLTGAPIIFMPGSAGSHKQVRSLASVALRKAMEHDRGVHFDYFTVDVNEEHSGIYGGYLEEQKQFLKLCITAVLGMYNQEVQGAAQQVTIIGHSMGGKVAQALLVSDAEIVNSINSIIFISTPLDVPVVNLDALINRFYEDSFVSLLKHRASNAATNTTDVCTGMYWPLPAISKNVAATETSHLLDNIVLISIGGGNRDLIVRDGITQSQFNDLHSMTSAIPRSWLSCDHMSSVWCLQVVQAINRFLFSIAIRGTHNYVAFQADKSQRLQAAYQQFVRPRNHVKTQLVDFMRGHETNNFWQQSTKRVQQKYFKNGIPKTYNLMIALAKYEQYKKLYVEVQNVDDNDWLYGCSAVLSEPDKYVCLKGYSLAHHIQLVHAKEVTRAAALIDMHNIRKTYGNWTHIILRFPPTHKPFGFQLDIHDTNERLITLKAPRWFNFVDKQLVNETTHGTLYYKLQITGLDEVSMGHQLHIKPRARLTDTSSCVVRTRLCVPWARGYERQQLLTSTSPSMFVNVPMSTPQRYNTTTHPVSVEIFLDPNCRYSISYQFSLTNTLSRIILEFYYWLPAHLVAVLCVVLKNQYGRFDGKNNVLQASFKPYIGYFQYISLHVITSSRIVAKLLLPVKQLPTLTAPAPPHHGIAAAVIVHSTAIALSILLSFLVWLLIVMHGTLLHNIAVRFTQISLWTISLFVSLATKFPLAIGALLIAVAVATCGCVSLILACLIYSIMMSNAYKDQIEHWLWTKTSNMAKKLYKKLSGKPSAEENNTNLASTEDMDSTSDRAITPVATETIVEDEPQEIDAVGGIQYFPFHITMFLLLVVVTLLNVPTAVAWLRNYRTGPRLPDPSLNTTIIILFNLSFIWQLKVPNHVHGYRFLSIALHIMACCAVLYGQEAVYRLNHIVAVIYTIVLIPEVINRVWNLISRRQR